MIMSSSESQMNGPVKDFSVTDTLGRRCFFSTEKSSSGNPHASAFQNAAGYLNKGYIWHFSLEEPSGKNAKFQGSVCLSHRASRRDILSAFSIRTK